MNHKTSCAQISRFANVNNSSES